MGDVILVPLKLIKFLWKGLFQFCHCEMFRRKNPIQLSNGFFFAVIGKGSKKSFRNIWIVSNCTDFQTKI